MRPPAAQLRGAQLSCCPSQAVIAAYADVIIVTVEPFVLRRRLSRVERREMAGDQAFGGSPRGRGGKGNLPRRRAGPAPGRGAVADRGAGNRVCAISRLTARAVICSAAVRIASAPTRSPSRRATASIAMPSTASEAAGDQDRQTQRTDPIGYPAAHQGPTPQSTAGPLRSRWPTAPR